MIKLRGHHLICLQFFNGEGYDPLFLEILREILRRADTELIEVIEGPDEVCRACPFLKEDQCRHPETSDAEIREMDRVALEILNLSPGGTVRWQKQKPDRLREGFWRWAENFCRDCSWRAACDRDPEFQALMVKALRGP